MPLVPIDLESRTSNMSLLIYALYGGGKTHFAGTAEDNLYLDFEGGVATLIGLPFKGRIYRVDDSSDLKDAIAPLGAEPEVQKKAFEKLGFKPKTVTIDTLTRMQHHSMINILDGREVKAGRDSDVMEMREWGQLLIRMYRLMKILPNEGYNILALAQAREFEDPDGIRKWMPNLTGQWGDQIGAYFDIVAYLQAKEVEKDGKRVMVHRLHLAPSGSWIAKSRYKNLPLYLDDATFPVLYETVMRARGIKEKGDNKK